MSGVREEGRRFTRPVTPASTRAKLFKAGGSQAVRLPKAFRFEGAEVNIRRDGDKVILEPVQEKNIPSPDEMKAFWAKVDSLMSGEAVVLPEDPYRPPPRWDDDA